MTCCRVGRCRRLNSTQSRAGLGPSSAKGLSMIAVSGLDMAAWDALARRRAAALRPARRLARAGAGLQQQRAMAAGTSRGCRRSLATTRRGRLCRLKLRLGRARPARGPRHLAAVRVRSAIGRSSWSTSTRASTSPKPCAAATCRRSRPCLDPGADRVRQSDGYAQLAGELKTPIQLGENFYGPRELTTPCSVRPAT